MQSVTSKGICEREEAPARAMHWRSLYTRGHSEITYVEGKIYQIIGAGKSSRIAGGVGISPVNKEFLTFMPPRKGDFKILKPVLEKQNILLTKHF